MMMWELCVLSRLMTERVDLGDELAMHLQQRCDY